MNWIREHVPTIALVFVIVAAAFTAIAIGVTVAILLDLIFTFYGVN